MILRIAPVPALLLLAACSGAEEADDPVVGTAAEDISAPAEVSQEVMEPGVDPDVGPAAETTAEAVEAADAPDTAEAAAAPAARPAATPVAAAATPPPAFAQCKACHAVEPGKTGIGPSLAGVFGARSAHMAGYDYSPAMEQAGLVWNEENLNAFLADPTGVVPGTKMPLGLQDQARRQAVIDYLKTL